MLSRLSPVYGRAIEARFDAAQTISDGGLLMPREIERRIVLATRLAGSIADPGAPERIQHGLDEVMALSSTLTCALRS